MRKDYKHIIAKRGGQMDKTIELIKKHKRGIQLGRDKVVEDNIGLVWV